MVRATAGCAVAACLAMAVACSRPPAEAPRLETTDVPIGDVQAQCSPGYRHDGTRCVADCPEGSRGNGEVCVASLSDAECPPGYVAAKGRCEPKLLDQCAEGRPAHPERGCEDDEPGSIGVLTLDPNAISEKLWGDEIGEAYGTGGLGLTPTENASGVELREVVAYGVSEKNVWAAASQIRERLDSCYTDSSVASAGEGSFEAVLRVEASGRVLSATVSGGPTEFGKVKQCLAHVLGSLEFENGGEQHEAAGVALRLHAGAIQRITRADDAATRPAVPRVRIGEIMVAGRLPTEVIERVVRYDFGRFRHCYEQGLSRNEALAGTVMLKFMIARDGSVATISDRGSELPDPEVIRCVVNGLRKAQFPQPDAGVVSVVLSISFGRPTTR